MEQQDEQSSEIKALLKVWLQVLISLIYTFFIVSKLPKGKARLFALIPVFYLFTVAPLSLSTPTTSGLSGFFFTWLANFRLVLFSFNLGPLAHDLPKKSFFGFLLVAAFPIKVINNQGNYGTAPKKKLPLGLGTKFLVYVLLVVSGVWCNFNDNVNKNVLLGIYFGVIYLSLEVVLGLYNKLLGWILGDVELAQPFNEPYLSTSLQDFWGRRWNLMVSDVLRHTIYFPVKSFWEVRVGRMLAQGLATMAAFVVSGLMHELLFYYITRASPTWEVTCFFLLHGVCLVVEIWLKRRFGLGDCAVHWAISGPATIGFVVGTGFWLFMPQLMRNQVDVRSIAELKAVGRLLENTFGWDITGVLGISLQ